MGIGMVEEIFKMVRIIEVMVVILEEIEEVLEMIGEVGVKVEISFPSRLTAEYG